MTIGSGADHLLQLNDAQQRSGIAGLSAKAASHAGFRDIEGAYSTPVISRRVRNEMIAGILAMIFTVAFVILLFFAIA